MDGKERSGGSLQTDIGSFCSWELNQCGWSCRGCDALQCAAEGAHASIFERLLAAGCDPKGSDHLDATLLHYAATGGCWEIIQKLLDLGCSKDAITKYGRTVLHYAAYSKPLSLSLSLFDTSVSEENVVPSWNSRRRGEGR